MQRIFYGWVVLAAAFVIIAFSIGMLFALGVFMLPVLFLVVWVQLRYLRRLEGA